MYDGGRVALFGAPIGARASVFLNPSTYTIVVVFSVVVFCTHISAEGGGDSTGRSSGRKARCRLHEFVSDIQSFDEADDLHILPDFVADICPNIETYYLACSYLVTKSDVGANPNADADVRNEHRNFNLAHA